MSADEARACVNAIREHWHSAESLLLELHDKHGWRALGYVSFAACIDKELAQSRAEAYRKMAAGRLRRQLAESVSNLETLSTLGALRTWHLRMLALLPDDERAAALEELSGDVTPGALRKHAARIKERVARLRTPVLVPVPPVVGPLRPELARWADGQPIPWADGTCRAIVTSPPFALGVPYADGGDVPDYATYRELMGWWAAELLRVASRRDGRLMLHVPFDRTLDLHAPVWAHWVGALEAAGWTYQTTIVAGDGTMSRSTAWGSHGAPSVCVPMEAVIVAYRGDWRQDGPRDLLPDELQRWAGPRGWWRDVVGEDDKQHPAVFDRRLVYRLLRIYTGPGDVVGDPFMGRGTVPVLAGLMGRAALGCDRSPTYVALAHHNMERGALGGRAIDLAALHRSAMEVPL